MFYWKRLHMNSPMHRDRLLEVQVAEPLNTVLSVHCVGNALNSKYSDVYSEAPEETVSVNEQQVGQVYKAMGKK